MLYEIEYWCRLCGKWLPVEMPPFESQAAALQAADLVARHYGGTVRIVDDFGNVLGVAG